MTTKMFDRLKSLLHPPEAKASRTARLIAFESGGRARWTPRDYAALAREGYGKNAIVHRAVRLIAESVGARQLHAVRGHGRARRSIRCSISWRGRTRARTALRFSKASASYLLLAGNAYIEAVGIAGRSQARAERARALRAAARPHERGAGADGWPQAFEYTVAGHTVRFDQSAPQPPILQLTLFHPLDDHYGLSPLEAAAIAVDTHNAAAKWNKALLDNAARPSGALVYAGPDGAVLSDQQFERLKRELDEQYQGARNAGRPLVLEGGLDWKAMSLSPKDMDFMEAKHAAAREIALAFGVPPMLLGDPRRQHLFELSGSQPRVLPPDCAAAGQPHRLRRWRSGWRRPSAQGLTLAVDTDRIEALAPTAPRCGSVSPRRRS